MLIMILALSVGTVLIKVGSVPIHMRHTINTCVAIVAGTREKQEQLKRQNRRKNKMRAGSIGATGSRNVPKKSQLSELYDWLQQKKDHIKEAHHGDCVGWDLAFHRAIIKTAEDITIHIHPPKNPRLRAYAHMNMQAPNKIIIHDEKEYLERNDNIVQSVSTLLAGPKDLDRTRSGTWYTIRKAQEAERNIIIFL
jgi:hypothetical protein